MLKTLTKCFAELLNTLSNLAIYQRDAYLTLSCQMESPTCEFNLHALKYLSEKSKVIADVRAATSL